MISPRKKFNFTKYKTQAFSGLAKFLDFLVGQGQFTIILVAVSLTAAFYWLVIASDRYVSEAHIVIERTDMPSGGSSLDLSTIISGQFNGSRGDQLLMRDHLLSVDMLRKLDETLNLRAHYSNPKIDPISKMWFKNAKMEWFYRYYLSRVSVNFDEYSGVLVIKAEAYDAKTAQAITKILLDEGEGFMNHMAQNLAQTQVNFLEKQVNQAREKLELTRQALLTYQNNKALIAPQATAEAINTIVSQLVSQKSVLETNKRALLAYLVNQHPKVIEINQQIAAIERQIEQEKNKLTSIKPGSLNKTVEEYNRLEMEAKFAEDLFKSATIALEQGHIEATRTIKKMSIVQQPSLPEYPMEPRRVFNTLMFIIYAIVFTAFMQLVLAIIKDHKD
jgi:capsular polysaccharide transport system permease protein